MTTLPGRHFILAFYDDNKDLIPRSAAHTWGLDTDNFMGSSILKIEYERMIMPTIMTEDEAKLGLKLVRTTKFFRALGDPSRLKILDSLLDGGKNVGELVELVGSSQGRVSNHLACLKQCGFVNTRRDGKFIYYSIADGEVRQLLQISQDMIGRTTEQ